MLKLKRYDLRKVFTPSTFAKLTFVDRENIKASFDRCFNNIGLQIVLYGLSGSGKTTYAVNYMEKNKYNYVITNCLSTMNINDIILDAFDKLGPYYLSDYSYSRTYKLSSQLKSDYLSMSSQISSSSEFSEGQVYKRILPPQLTINKIVDYFIKTNCVWIIDDFHKIAHEERKKISEIAKVFSDFSHKSDFARLIVIGAVENATDLIVYNKEIRERCAEIEFSLLSSEEIYKVISKGFSLLNIVISGEILNEIVSISNSLCSVSHRLSSDICNSLKVKKTAWFTKKANIGIFNEALELTSQQYSATYRAVLDNASKQRRGQFQNVKAILWAISTFDKIEITYNEIFEKIKSIYPEYPSGNLTNYLRYLQEDDFDHIVIQSKSSGNFYIQNAIFKAFLRMYFRQNPLDSNALKKELLVDDQRVRINNALMLSILKDIISK